MSSNQRPMKPGLPVPQDPSEEPSSYEIPYDYDESEDFEHLLEESSHLAPPGDGEVLQGTVLKVTAKDVIVDIGYKSEGLAPL